MRLYSNENFPLPVVLELRRLGYDVLTLQETGQGERALPDEAVLEFAHSEHRVLLTFNRKHFFQLHARGAAHSGIVACTFDTDFVGLAQRIHKALQNTDNIAGQVIRVNRSQPNL